MSGIVSDVGRWGMVPEWLLDTDISCTAVKLFATLGAKWADRGTQEAHPSRREIAEAMHASVDTVDRAIRELVSVGALEICPRFDAHGDQVSNLYVLKYAAPGGQPCGPLSGTDAAPMTRINDQKETTSPSKQARDSSKVESSRDDPNNEAFVFEAIAQFGDALGGATAVREQIEAALNHKAYDKARSKRTYVLVWLRRSVKFEAERKRDAATGAGRNGSRYPERGAYRPPPSENYGVPDAVLRRQEREAAAVGS